MLMRVKTFFVTFGPHTGVWHASFSRKARSSFCMKRFLRREIMKNLILIFAFAALATGAALLTFDLEPGFSTRAANTTTEPAAADKPGKTMRPFASAKELKDYFASLAEKQ